MAANTGKSTRRKKSASKAAKKTARQGAKKATKKITKKSQKKAAGTSAGKKSTKKKVAKKDTSKKATKKSARTQAKAKARTDEVELDVDAIAEVEDLIEADLPLPDASAKRGPKTPTVPRAVKPAPREVENDMGTDVLEFIAAIDKYKAEHCRPFPNWTEVFHILRQLGYRKN